MKIKFLAGITGLGLVALCSCGNQNSSRTNETNNSITSTTEIVENDVKVIEHSDSYYKVSFDTMGHGGNIKTEAIDKGNNSLAVKPSNPKEAGYKFCGWYKDKEFKNKYDFSEVLNGDITLYAKWKEYKGVGYDTNEAPSIYLAGDSTVQTYSESQYIGGWGQYFDLFFDEDVNVVNCARGGRSSRSFINEGRLFTGTTYSFSENGGKSIEESIEAGDYLFVQFGHNDDDTKDFEDTGYKYERMVPLGEPDANGIYPTIAPTNKQSTTANLPGDMTEKTKAEIAKYGDTYYAYDKTGSNGTYKGYLKEYIDFARSKGATPVLCTPVARVAFQDGKIVGGPGRHGDDFAYVKAVRQLAEEEQCLLIDNFEFSKKILEIATKDFSDFLMAIVPNTLDNGPWPQGYDNAYQNAAAGYDKMEATHYNKYGAYLTAAYVAESIINSDMNGIVKGKGDTKEYFNFVDHILENPFSYVNPSNRLSISKVNEIEGLFENVFPTDPNRTYISANVAIKAIDELKAKGAITDINETNYESWLEYCKEARAVYESLNFDIRKDVSNYNDLVTYEAAAKAARPKAIKTVVLSADDFVDVNTPITSQDHIFSFADDIVTYNKKAAGFTFNEVEYGATSKSIRLPGNSSTNTKRYIEFNVEGKCEITIISSGGGETKRYIQLTKGATKICDFDVEPSQTVFTNVVDEAGTYRVGSTGSNIDVYYIIIEYYA